MDMDCAQAETTGRTLQLRLPRRISRLLHALSRLHPQGQHLSRVQLEFCNGKDSRMAYGRKVEEYIADFCLVSRNVRSRP